MLDKRDSRAGYLLIMKCCGFKARILLLLLFTLVVHTAHAERAESLCSLSATALVEASQIRGLKKKVDVPCVVKKRSQIRRFLEETIREELPPERLRHEELLYKSIGLIPEQYEYKEGLVSFLVSQIGGYYDPKAKQFVMASWLPSIVQRSVAIHELTHALQDQHFDLARIIDAKALTTDEGLAHSAIVEGDASAVMFDKQFREGGAPPLARQGSIEGILLTQVLGQGAMQGVPESIKGMLMFPYTSGLRFAHAALRRGGYTVLDTVYGKLPSTTREILHPEEYFEGSVPVSIPSDAELTDERVLYSDVIGEFGISSLFAGSSKLKLDGVTAAVGWIGDRAVLIQSEGGKPITRWLLRWETSHDAAEFCQAYKHLLEKRFGGSFGSSGILISGGKEVSLRCSEREVLFESKNTRQLSQ